MMWLIALEIVGFSGAQNGRLLTHADLQAAGQNEAAFLAIVRNGMAAGACDWLVTFLAHLEGLVAQVGSNLL